MLSEEDVFSLSLVESEGGVEEWRGENAEGGEWVSPFILLVIGDIPTPESSVDEEAALFFPFLGAIGVSEKREELSRKIE